MAITPGPSQGAAPQSVTTKETLFSPSDGFKAFGSVRCVRVGVTASSGAAALFSVNDQDNPDINNFVLVEPGQHTIIAHDGGIHTLKAEGLAGASADIYWAALKQS